MLTFCSIPSIITNNASTELGLAVSVIVVNPELVYDVDKGCTLPKTKSQLVPVNIRVSVSVVL